MADPSPAPLPAGAIVGERYRVIGHLGTGGMGAVYQVEHTVLGKRLALKLLRPELSQQATVGERFEREARSAARLDHARIVRVTDFGRASDGALFMVMELIEGRPLSEVMAHDGRIPAARALALADQVLDALAHAHAHGVVHRDIKPANVMVGDAGVKLVDFGIAKLSASEDASLTQVGAVIGTPRYMSPEQAAGEPVDARTDLYAVGVLLFELLSGRAPYEGVSSMEVLTKHLTAAVPRLVIPGLDPAQTAALDAVVGKALSKRREERFATAEALREALAAASAAIDGRPAAIDGRAAAIDGRAATTDGRPFDALAARVRGIPLDALARARRAGVDALARARRAWIAAPVRARRASVALGGAVLLVVLVLALRGPGAPAASALVANGEAALGRGDLVVARAVAIQALAESPDDPRVHLLQASIALAEDQPELALDSFRRAITLDRGAAADPRLAAAIRSQLARDGKAAPGLVALVTSEGDARVAPLLAELARTANKPALRKDAFAALERLDEADRLDVLAWLTEELRAKQPCAVRKWYVDRLIALDDPRTLPTLKKELGRRGGFLNLSSDSDCMAAELKAHIQALAPEKDPE